MGTLCARIPTRRSSLSFRSPLPCRYRQRTRFDASDQCIPIPYSLPYALYLPILYPMDATRLEGVRRKQISIRFSNVAQGMFIAASSSCASCSLNPLSNSTLLLLVGRPRHYSIAFISYSITPESSSPPTRISSNQSQNPLTREDHVTMADRSPTPPTPPPLSPSLLPAAEVPEVSMVEAADVTGVTFTPE